MALRTQKLVPTGKLICNGREYWLIDTEPKKRHDWAGYNIYELLVVPVTPHTDDNGMNVYKKVTVQDQDGGDKEIAVKVYPSPRLITTTSFTIEWGMPDSLIGYIFCSPTNYSDIPDNAGVDNG
jgi:hypothetical protein